jgi:bifunctional N-acetylglucosamine-1-phosphate-uridyltransferase/glucosamine-1-phosphate-acetyltransferase GlmU-like protein
MHERYGCAALIRSSGEGKRVAVFTCDQREEVIGINTAEQLHAAERLMKKDG